MTMGIVPNIIVERLSRFKEIANATMGKLKGALAIINVKDDPSLDGLRCVCNLIGTWPVQRETSWNSHRKHNAVLLSKQNLVKLGNEMENIRSCILVRSQLPNRNHPRIAFNNDSSR
jgi:hypothetical protein